MPKDILKETIEQIKSWCSKNNISIFYGEIDKNRSTEVKWSRYDDSDWEEYLTVLKNAGPKILTITIEVNEVEDKDAFIADYLESLDEEEKEAYSSALANVSKNKGQIASYVLTFFDGGISYRYQDVSDWIVDYRTVEEANEFDADENDKRGLTDNNIEEAARKVLVDKRYLAAKNRSERHGIASAYIKKDAIAELPDVLRICRKAEEIFEAEIKPQLEAELAKQVLALKAKKLTKVAIASKLKISRDLVNRFYYVE